MSHVIKLRDLRSERVGKLVSINGTVTRTSEVRPELLFGTFKCIHCSQENAYVEQQFRYTEPKVIGVYQSKYMHPHIPDTYIHT